MRVRFWGTRGSIPTPGEKTVRYGGNTPCVEVRPQPDDLIILDAGTGIRQLGDELIASGEALRSVIAITHPHSDHIQGFPFFKPLFVPGNEFTVLGPKTSLFTLERAIADVMNKVYFPVHLDELEAKIRFQSMEEGSLQVAGARLSASFVNHPSVTFGYRIDAGGKSVVYISDNEPFDIEASRSLNNVDKVVVDRFLEHEGNPNAHIFEFANGADVLIHDATFTPDEYKNHIGWGHSHYLYSIEVAREAGAGKLILFHHDYMHDDEMVDEIVVRCRQEIKKGNYGFECEGAAEGMILDW